MRVLLEKHIMPHAKSYHDIQLAPPLLELLRLPNGVTRNTPRCITEQLALRDFPQLTTRKHHLKPIAEKLLQTSRLTAQRRAVRNTYLFNAPRMRPFTQLGNPILPGAGGITRILH